MFHKKSNILFRPGIVEILERNAEASGNGSIFRACLAVLRCCDDPSLESEMTTLITRSWHPAAIDTLEIICAEHASEAEGEL